MFQGFKNNISHMFVTLCQRLCRWRGDLTFPGKNKIYGEGILLPLARVKWMERDLTSTGKGKMDGEGILLPLARVKLMERGSYFLWQG